MILNLKAEGRTIEPGKGKKPPKVKDFEKKLNKEITILCSKTESMNTAQGD